MIKKYNENWGPKGGSRKGTITINAKDGDELNSTIQRAINVANMENSKVILNISGIELEVNPQSDINNILNNYNKEVKFSENDKDYWKDYWEQRSKDSDSSMDTIDDYAMKHSISRTDAERYFKSNNKINTQPVDSKAKTHMDYLSNATPKFQKGDVIYDYTYRMYGKVMDYRPNNEDSYLIDFEDGTSVWLDGEGLSHSSKKKEIKSHLTPVVGIPSGEIIYMNEKQLKYFKVRSKVIYRKIYRKINIDGIELVDLEEYTFRDWDNDDIKTIIDLYTWI